MKLVEQFFRILAPANCLACGSEGSLLCTWCTEDALPGVVPRCYRCNALSHNSATCKACRRKSNVSHLWMRTEHTHIARKLVHAMKFKYSSEAAQLIARELAGIIPALPPETIITYVPAATSHARQRGFDHARAIARELSRQTGLPFLPTLARHGQDRQVGAGRERRLSQMAGVFRPRMRASIPGSTILLVDDVVTTGATIESAAKVLKAAGAKQVDAAIFAQAK
ncbi:MAG: phosphoribosyltransferase family protein [Candidatus Saccharimonadales bacterium]